MEYTSKKAIIAEKYKIMLIIMTTVKKTKAIYPIKKKPKTIETRIQADKVLNLKKKTVVYSVSIAKIFIEFIIDLPYFFTNFAFF